MDFADVTTDLFDQMREVFGDEAVDQALAEMADGVEEERRKVLIQKARIAQANRTVTDRAIGRSGLRPTLDVPDLDYYYWGLRLGFECWDDPEFLAEYARDNPEFVPVLEKKTNSIIVPGFVTPRPEVQLIA